jgi:putative polyhydroxyalkanoate system protein
MPRRVGRGLKPERGRARYPHMSRPVTISIPHSLGKAEARSRIDKGFDQMKAQMAAASVSNMRQAWAGDRLNFNAQALGQTFNGAIDVGEQDIRIEVALPGLLGMFAGKIAGKLKQQGTLLLEKK